jgi:hypothetical protein
VGNWLEVAKNFFQKSLEQETADRAKRENFFQGLLEQTTANSDDGNATAVTAVTSLGISEKNTTIVETSAARLEREAAAVEQMSSMTFWKHFRERREQERYTARGQSFKLWRFK